jgi:heme-degrading monooxygenase HmoA
VFEILTFRLAPGVDADTFRAIDERVQTEFAYQQPGFVRRTLGRHDDDRWLVLTIWADAASALAARERFDASDLGREFTALVTDAVIERFRGVD